MSYSRKICSISVAFLVMLMVNSCQKESTRINAEAKKNIAGSWKIAAVTRNGVDITNYFDFTGFEIQFREDGSYMVGNQAPFIIAQNGTWSLDDDTHPLRLSFTPQGGSQAVLNEFDYPVVEGVRRIILKGSPGCTSNVYQYSLEEIK